MGALWSSSEETDLDGTVHIVDDDTSFRTSIERRLEKDWVPYRVETYEKAQQLPDQWPDGNEPCCILLDAKMPGLSLPINIGADCVQ